tara:strand:- start:15971 stop:16342 length:372 start_codon:yes stop_codon:yes gene_type:complete
MKRTVEIKEAVIAFIKAGDTNDVQLLGEVLHQDYQNVQDGFFGEQGLFRFSKSDYMERVGKKIFGGVPRTIIFRSIELYGAQMAVVNATLARKDLLFRSVIVVVKDIGDWKILYNLPRIEVVP